MGIRVPSADVISPRDKKPIVVVHAVSADRID
jgi:hypothetical protein